MYSDSILVESKHFEKRGSIYTIYDQRKMPQSLNFVQDKIAKSNQGVIRGFHGDNKTWKLITCLQGSIKLVTFNIDSNERSVYLLNGDSTEAASVLVPPRTLNAHQCLSQGCIFHYKWSEFYTAPEDQWSVHYDDPDICPEWDKKLHITVSERDKKSPTLREFRHNVK